MNTLNKIQFKYLLNVDIIKKVTNIPIYMKNYITDVTCIKKDEIYTKFKNLSDMYKVLYYRNNILALYYRTNKIAKTEEYLYINKDKVTKNRYKRKISKFLGYTHKELKQKWDELDYAEFGKI